MISFILNGVPKEVDVEPEMPLLWVLREELGMRGTKFGCGIAQCGACTVHVDGSPVRSCVMPVTAIAGKKIKTIEALGDAQNPHPIQQAWLDHQVPQCGYCQSGMQMTAAALLEEKPSPTDEDINKAITNICRCGCYERIRAAIHDAAKVQQAKAPKVVPTGETQDEAAPKDSAEPQKQDAEEKP